MSDVVIGAIVGGLIGNGLVWLYFHLDYLKIEKKDQRIRRELGLPPAESSKKSKVSTEHWTQEEIDAHEEAKSIYGVGPLAVSKRVAFEDGAKWAAKQSQKA